MRDLYWRTNEPIKRLRPNFPKSHGRPRGDDRLVLRGFVFVDRHGLRWLDQAEGYRPHKALNKAGLGPPERG